MQNMSDEIRMRKYRRIMFFVACKLVLNYITIALLMLYS